MPIQVKTMRDIWDKKRKKKEAPKENPWLPTGQVKRHKTLPPEIEKYYLDYLARKKAFLEIKDEIAQAFSDYKTRLGDAGFSKI